MTVRALPLLLLPLLAAGCSAQGYQPQPKRCHAPTGAEGECVPVTRCPSLLALLRASSNTPGAADFLRRSLCGSEYSDRRVCCVQGFRYEPPSKDEKTTTTPRPTQQPMPTNQQLRQQQTNDHRNARLLPTECGVDFAERIFGGTVTEINEYPWLALLRYRTVNGQLEFLCGGALFNSRYVLTASHCINGRDIIRNNYRLVSVRLGEYDIDTERDCVDETCADPPQDIGVEEALPHPDYEPNNRDQFNDIGLLRLDRDAPTTSYIRPICLPMNSVSYVGEDVVVTGWGLTENGTYSSVKLKVAVPVVSDEVCQRVYSRLRSVSSSTQMCAGGQKGKDSCTGDSGGPLMAVDEVAGTNRHVAAGVVSYGPKPCGRQDWPGVYTRVSAFVPWILDSIRP